ncbi:DUF2333 family protein [Halomonas borealis]|uniref:DUF2333 family protein n=1 Tax=Halomonas borealis TaxID=2508710 RepID=UPI00109FF0B9|nr:DUF2333 family protein [Halomonas borealis]
MAVTRQAAERRRRRKEALERPQYGWIWKPLLVALAIYLLVAVGLGIWWSRTPALEAAQQADAAPGAASVDGLSGLVDTLLDKPGGYLRNDMTPPGLWLDNMPAWELGVLDQARWLSQSLVGRDASALDAARTALEGDGDDGVYPSTEHRLEQARSALQGYRRSLGGGSGVAVEGRELAAWLEGVARRLDDMGRRLSASVANPEALAGLDLDVEDGAQKTPWYRLDNVFFEARGQTWALHRLLEAIHRDQAARIEAAGLAVRWDALSAELELSQRRLWSPVVLNGSGFGPFANHSLTMAHHVLRARDLSRELSAGLAEAGGASGVSTPAADDTPGKAAVEGATQPPAEDAADASAAEDDAESLTASQADGAH